MKKMLIGTGVLAALILTGCNKKTLVVNDDNYKGERTVIDTKSSTILNDEVKVYHKKIPKRIPCFITNQNTRLCSLTLEASGMGAVPASSINSAQSIAMARKSAILEAYKELAAKMYGIKIEGRDSVRNMVLQNSSIRAYVKGVIRGANIEDESYKNGLYTVVLSVKLDAYKWYNDILNNPQN